MLLSFCVGRCETPKVLKMSSIQQLMVRWYQKTLEMVYSTVNSQKEIKGQEYVRLIREALSITNTHYVVKMNYRFLRLC